MNAPRKLAPILAADIAGYSRLMRADEEGTLAQPHRQALIPRLPSTTAGSSMQIGDRFLSSLDVCTQSFRPIDPGLM